jgi:hypothetical protein
MKKLIVGLLAALLMTTGLVAFSGSPAQAACPYQSCLETATVGVAIPKKANVKIKAKVVALGSNVKPTGNIYLVVNKKKKNGNFKVVAELTGTVSNGKNVFLVEGLKKGKYKYGVEFKGNQDEGFGYSIGFGRFKIKKTS